MKTIIYKFDNASLKMLEQFAVQPTIPSALFLPSSISYGP